MSEKRIEILNKFFCLANPDVLISDQRQSRSILLDLGMSNKEIYFIIGVVSSNSNLIRNELLQVQTVNADEIISEISKDSFFSEDSVRELIEDLCISLQKQTANLVSQTNKATLEIKTPIIDNTPSNNACVLDIIPADIPENAIEDYREAINGNVKKQYMIGLYYKNGENGFQQSFEKAFEWFMRAANNNDSESMIEIGHMYTFNQGVTESYDEAERWLLKSYNLGNEKAELHLGILYRQMNRKSDAIYYLKQSADKNNSEAMLYLGLIYILMPTDRERRIGIEWLKKATELQNTDAMYNLARCYEYGRGVWPNEKEAFRYYMMGANYGDDECQYMVGYCYRYGKGVWKSKKEALKWFDLAVEKENQNAMYERATLYESGKCGSEKSKEKAIELYKKCADKGNLEVIARLKQLK